MTLSDLIRGRKGHVATATAEPDGEALAVAKKAQIAVAVAYPLLSDDCVTKLSSLSKKQNKSLAVAAVDESDPMEVTRAKIATVAVASRPEPVVAKPDRAIEPIPRSPVEQILCKKTMKSCLMCTHYKRPGRSDGYCGGGREDLSAAYGPNHPLRRLPDDFGATCVCFVSEH